MPANRLLPLCFALLAGFAGASAAQAQVNPEFAGRLIGSAYGEKGGAACFVRSYDKAHLAAHPLQKATHLRFIVRASGQTDGDNGSYSFAVGLTQRGKNGLFTSSGSCSQSRAEGGEGPVVKLHCGVDCDGGSVDLEVVNGGKSILLKLESGISVDPPGSRPDEEPNRVGFSAGADDKVFRLDRVAIEQCGKIFPEADTFKAFVAGE